jgi:uncharacterized delta-60 repeat protein
MRAGWAAGRAFLALALAVPVAVRANPGDLDQTFGRGGMVTTPIGSSAAAARALAVQADGRLVAAGYSGPAFALARYDGDGSLDATFGSGGTVIGDVGFSAGTLVVQADGKLVAAGYRNGDLALVRYLSGGTLDPSFGDGGTVTVAGDCELGCSLGALAVQADGKLVTAGGRNYGFELVRYDADGRLDPSFGDGGRVTTHFGDGRDAAAALVVQADGKLVAAGYSDGAFALARYEPDGGLDESFGSEGMVRTAFAAGSQSFAHALAIEPDGKLVAAGNTGCGVCQPPYALAVARYDGDGSLDATFGSGGRVTTAIGSADASARNVTVQADGKLVAAAGSALVRYRPDGSLDPTFGSAGTVTTPIVARDVVLQADGKLVAAGGNGDFALVRYMNDVCGDGLVQSGEQCDEGAANGSTASCCTAACTFESGRAPCTDGACDGAGACATATSSTTTTTSTLPCTTARCTIEATLRGPECAGETVPRIVTRKLDRAIGWLRRAESGPPGQASRSLGQAKHALERAGKAAGRAAKGRRPKLTPSCATAIRHAAGTVMSGLPP